MGLSQGLAGNGTSAGSGGGGAVSSVFTRTGAVTAQTGDYTAAQVGAFANPMTTLGDVIVGGASGVATRQALGTNGQYLGVSGGVIGYSTPPLALSLRDQYTQPTAALYDTMPRFTVSGAGASGTGSLYLSAIALPTGLTIGHIAYASSSTAASAPTHWWYGLWDNNLNQLATTADQTNTAFAATTLKSLAIATIASGASATFTTTYTGLYYLGFMMAAGTVCTIPINTPITSSVLMLLSPPLAGTSTTGLTTPPAFPSTATALNSGTVGNMMYAYVAT